MRLLLTARDRLATPVPVDRLGGRWPGSSRAAARRLRAVDGWAPLLIGALVAAFYTATSLQRHENLGTGAFDLGVFEQDVQSWAHLRLPVSTLKGPDFHRLGDHFSPIVALAAPVYRVFPSAVTLLVIQSLLLGAAVVPLMRFAYRRLGPAAMVVVGVAFGFSWGIANAADFDFHEVAFAVPLLVLSGIAYVERRELAAVLWAVPLVLVKEDMGLTLAVLGVLVAVRGRRRLGIVTACGGVLATALEVLVIIPAANPAGRNDRSGYFTGSFVHDALSWSVMDTKLTTLVWLLAPTAFLAVRSSVAWLAVPTLLWRFTADHAAFWGTSYHYSAVLMPVVFVAFVDVLTRWRGRTRRWWWPLVVTAAVTVAAVRVQSLDQTLHPSFWRTTAATAEIHHLLDTIPSGVTVGASNNLGAQLTARDDVSLIGRTPLGPTGPQYAVVDLTRTEFPFASAAEAQRVVARARADGYRQIGAAAGVVLLTRLR